MRPLHPLLAALALAACQSSPHELRTTEPAKDKPTVRSTDPASPGEAVADEPASMDEKSTPEDEPHAPTDAPATDEQRASPALYLRLPDPFAALPHADAQLQRLCARGQQDLVTDVFCAARPPRVASLLELYRALGVDPNEDSPAGGLSVTGHSTALSKRSVSAINPRVLFLHIESADRPLLALAFARGETVVEVATRDRASRELQFYALSFSLPCSERAAGCTPGELLTSAIERDWQGLDVYGEEDLKNTTLDCRTCHQPDGPGSAKLLRMQELESPWTHWFDRQTGGGRALIADFVAAHEGDDYAGVSSFRIGRAQAGLLTAFARIAGSGVQPNEFPSVTVAAEVEESAPGQPEDNRTAGSSKSWQAIYQVALRGDAIPTPYHDVKVTAPDKLARMTQALTNFRNGRLALRELPDLRDVHTDDPVQLAEMSFMVDDRLEDSALLPAACGLCHNGRLDQTLSRARFHTDLARLSSEAKQAARERLALSPEDPLAMPPRRTHELSSAARARLVALLAP